MAPIARIKVRLSAFSGAPGVMTFYCLDPATFRPGLVAFMAATAPLMADTVVCTTEAAGDIINDANGDITGSWFEGAEVIHNGATGGAYSAASGAVISWNTTAVVNSRRLRGRTFIVPLGGAQNEGNGTLSSAFLNSIRSNAATLIAASPGQMLVWSRPVEAGTFTAAGVAVPPRAGSSASVASATIRDKVAVLRSRRD